MSKKQKERKERLMPGGIPRYIRCYDNGGETADRYTVVYTGNYTHKTLGEHFFTCMSDNPWHPQGVGMHDSSPTLIDRPRYSHLGKKISFGDLPENCQKLVLADYNDIWEIVPPDEILTGK